MIGKYRFYVDGELVSESKNILTTEGRALILRYLAGEVPDWAGGIAVGTQPTTATINDRRLAFESERAGVNLKVSKPSTNSVVARATLSPDLAGYIYEVGLLSGFENPESPGLGTLLALFDSEQETMTGGTDEYVNYRVSDKSRTVAATTTGVAVEFPTFVADFSQYQNQDTFALAYFGAANAGNIRVDFLVDDTNYYRYTFAAATSGYNVHEWARSAAVATGTPSWEAVQTLRITVFSTTGTSDVTLDALRINDVDYYTTYGLVSRSVLASPIPKVEGKEIEIEYEVTLTF